MNTVSDGQRRRVQICMGLLKPYQVLLLDEITVDMDVLGRLDLLEFFRRECEERGATIVYATHIFDGLEPWVTHVAYAAQGKLLRGEWGPPAHAQSLSLPPPFPARSCPRKSAGMPPIWGKVCCCRQRYFDSLLLCVLVREGQGGGWGSRFCQLASPKVKPGF